MPRAKYPHLLSEDVPVWERFLASVHNRFTEIDYDVRVGIGRDPGPVVEEKFREMGRLLSQRRIDAVGINDKEVCVIEITTIADLKAIGQMTSYPILYKQTYRPELPITRLLICAVLESDIRTALDGASIPFLQLPG